ncbi:hypothetical protein IWX47DRAFT_155741 [Phyllosticta citricarpa]
MFELGYYRRYLVGEEWRVRLYDTVTNQPKHPHPRVPESTNLFHPVSLCPASQLSERVKVGSRLRVPTWPNGSPTIHPVKTDSSFMGRNKGALAVMNRFIRPFFFSAQRAPTYSFIAGILLLILFSFFSPFLLFFFSLFFSSPFQSGNGVAGCHLSSPGGMK